MNSKIPEYVKKIVDVITHTASVCGTLWIPPENKLYAEPTDILLRNRRSHGLMYPTVGLHSRSGTLRRPRFIV